MQKYGLNSLIIIVLFIATSHTYTYTEAIDTIRANKTKTKFADDLTHLLESEWSLGSTVEQEFTASNIKDGVIVKSGV